MSGEITQAESAVASALRNVARSVCAETSDDAFYAYADEFAQTVSNLILAHFAAQKPAAAEGDEFFEAVQEAERKVIDERNYGWRMFHRDIAAALDAERDRRRARG